jgi:AdoMet-dependent heme synthase
LDSRIPLDTLRAFVRDERVIPNAEEYCRPPQPAGPDKLNAYPCGAGTRACYISPWGDVMPCVTYPVHCGNVRQQRFADIWHGAEGFCRIRGVRVRDLPVCSGCANLAECHRCPGLAHLAGDATGPSALDCERAYARTGVPTPLFPLLSP